MDYFESMHEQLCMLMVCPTGNLQASLDGTYLLGITQLKHEVMTLAINSY